MRSARDELDTIGRARAFCASRLNGPARAAPIMSGLNTRSAWLIVRESASIG